MKTTTRPYREVLMEKLADADVAAEYLNAAMQQSPEVFLKSLRNVARARQMAKVAKTAGVQRENLYRALSEQGNPTLDTLAAVLGALGMRLSVSPAPVKRRTARKLAVAAEK